MTCTLSLGPDNNLELRTPSGRSILVPVSPHATDMLWQVLWNATQERRQVGRHSYAGEYPSQHIIDLWVKDVMPQRDAEREAELAEARAAKAAEKAAKLEAKLGIKLDDLEFDL